MTMRPEDIQNRTFANALRGYDKDEVRSFLFRVAEASRELHDRLAATEAQVASSAETGDSDTAGTDAGASPERASGFVADVHDAESPATPDFTIHDDNDLAATERSIADRYGALGDRIAELLRNADESAAAILSAAETDSAEMRAAAESDAAELRTEAEPHAAQPLAEAGAIRDEADAHRAEVMAEIEAAQADQDALLADARATAEAEIETLRVSRLAEIDDLRNRVDAEVEEMRSSAEHDLATLRETTIAEGEAALAEREVEAARLLDEAENDRQAARAELEEVRSVVAGLLEQARTQSEFIRQEADEIIRTKVRANFEQAQARIDVLRNTEVASRERIVRAQTELTSALSRLDAEPVPALDPTSAPAIIEEAEQRHDGVLEGSSATGDSAATAGGILDVFETDEHIGDGDIDDEAGIIVGDEPETDTRATFEADVAEANQQIDDEQSPLSAFLGTGSSPHDDEGTDAEPFGSRFDFSPQDVDATESADETASAPFGSGGFGAEGFGSAGFGTAAPDVSDPAVDHESVDDAAAEHPGVDDSPADAGAHDADVDDTEGDLGPATLEEALPDDGIEVGGAAEEDALARLVREAMQEAVDSARKND